VPSPAAKSKIATRSLNATVPPRLEPSVIPFDPVVRVLRGVMKNVGEKVVDDAQQRCGQVGGDLPRPGAAAPRQWRVASGENRYPANEADNRNLAECVAVDGR
jgi:hypothetical protein